MRKTGGVTRASVLNREIIFTAVSFLQFNTLRADSLNNDPLSSDVNTGHR
jgi:hypothetical protein